MTPDEINLEFTKAMTEKARAEARLMNAQASGLEKELALRFKGESDSETGSGTSAT